MRQRAVFVGLIGWVAIGCAEFDTTRVPVARGTLGEEIVRVFCERLASEANPNDITGVTWKPVCRGEIPPPADAPARLVVLMERRQRLSRALDRVFPEQEIGDDLGHFLGELLPLYDPPEERLPTSARRVAELLELVASDRDAMDALAQLGAREGYQPLASSLSVLPPVLAYPEFDGLANDVLRAIAPEGIASAEWQQLQHSLALEMASLTPPEPAPAGDRTTLQLTRDLLFREDDAFRAGEAAGPRWLLRRDARGLALPAGAIAAPFVDGNRDGLADVDEMGRFVGADGAVLALPTPFALRDESGVARDATGRALRADGSRYFEYLDLDRTLLAGVLRETGALFDLEAPAALQLARGLPAVVGPETTLTATYGSRTWTYAGPDTTQGSLFDLLHALTPMIERPSSERAMVLFERLLRDHEPQIAALVMATDETLERIDTLPDAQLEPNNVLLDDLIQVVTEFAQEPGLLDVMMRAFADPRSAQLGAVYADLMRHRDRISYDPANPNGRASGLPLDEQVNRTQGDTRANESLFQRSIALIDGLNGVRLCNREGSRLNLTIRVGPLSMPFAYPLVGRAGECDIIDIRNVAEAYSLSITGDYELEIQSGPLNALTNVAGRLGISVDAALERSSGIEGLTRRPTPQAMSRLVFWGLDNKPGQVCSPSSPDGCNSLFSGQLFAPLRDRHGNDVIDTYEGTIFMWEQPGFYDGMTPLLEALHRPEYRYSDAGVYRFGQLIGTLHRHWASKGNWLTQSTDRNAPNFSYQTGAVRFEEAIAEGLDEHRLVARLQRLTALTRDLQVDPGYDGIRVLAEATRDLVDPARHRGLTTRDGRTTLTTADGARALPVTPALAALDAVRRIDADLDEAPERREAWESGASRLAEVFLGTRPLGEEATFTRPRGRTILLNLLPFFRQRIAVHRESGDLGPWSRTLLTDAEETVRSPLVWSAVRLLDRVQEDAAARDALAAFIRYLLDETSSNDAFGRVLLGGGDALQLLDDDETLRPIVRVLSRALAPNAPEHVARADGEPLNLEGSVATDSVRLIRSVQTRDERAVLARILANTVRSTGTDGERAPLEEILDVIGELNRVAPGDGGTLDADDYASTLGAAADFMTDETRGLERLFRVVQERQVRQ